MVHDGSVTRLIQLLRSGDATERDLAARLIWRRYFRDLLELARNNLDRRIRRREDEEDVLQSMYKSFCLRQQRGEFDLAGRDALWKLLVTITLRKARNVAKKQTRDQRDVAREQTIADRDDGESARWRSSRWTPPVRRPPRRPCSTRLWSVAWRPWATPSCARSLSGGWRATPTARSPIGSTVPSGRSSGGWSGSAANGRPMTIGRHDRGGSPSVAVQPSPR